MDFGEFMIFMMDRNEPPSEVAAATRNRKPSPNKKESKCKHWEYLSFLPTFPAHSPDGEDEEEHKEEEDPEREDVDGQELLNRFGIPHKYIDGIIARMEEENMCDPEDWQDIYEDEQFLMETLGFPNVGQCRKFKRKFSKYLKEKNQ